MQEGSRREENINPDIEEQEINLFDIGKKIKSAREAGKIDEAKEYFGDFINKAEPLMRQWLEAMDRHFGNGKDTYFASLIDDAIQECSVKIYKNFDAFFSNIESEKALMGWLYVATRNAYITRIRRKKHIDKHELTEERAQQSLENDIIDPNPEPSEQIALDEIMGLIKEIVNNIEGDKTKEIAQLLYIEHWTEKEIIAKYGMSEHQFRNWHSRIRRIIAENLEKTGFEKIDELLLDAIEKKGLREINEAHKKALQKAEKVKEACKNKNISVDVDAFLELDKKLRAVQMEVESLRAQKNKLGKDDVEKGRELKEKLKGLEENLATLDQQRLDLHKKIPNIPADDVPVGKTEDENQVIKTVCKKPSFNFPVKNHWQLGQELDLIDKERAAKVAGSRFAYLKGPLVQLQWAMMQFAVSVLTDEKILKKIAKGAKLAVSTKPFIAVLPPLMIKTEPYDAMDRLEPREERYKIEGEDLWLQGSAEHVLGTMHMQETLPEQFFPIRYVGYATSFRREAGTYGKDMEGIIRMHQFDKLEMESLTVAEESLQEHHFMVAIQEYLMQQLGLPYEVVLKCTADIGKPNARGVDINVWLPGQDKYRETHTADYMTDYQARRLQTRVRRNSGETQLVHTNDATAFSQRPLIAILENFQQKDGSVKVPAVLHKFGAPKVIKAKK